jgi:hypothetical protein
MTIEPIYTLRHAFEIEPICTVFGFDGLRRTIPQLDVGLYSIMEGPHEVGQAEHHASGRWRLDVNGRTAGPGYLIV